MENILDRVSQLADNEGIKITSLEKKIGASKGVLSRALKNKTHITSNWLTSIVENYPQYSADWLLTGKGEKLKRKESSLSLVSEPGTGYGNNDSEMVDFLKKNISHMEKVNEHLMEEVKELRSQIAVLKKKLSGANQRVEDVRKKA